MRHPNQTDKLLSEEEVKPMAVRVSTQPGKATEDEYMEVGIERAQGTITLRTGRLTVQEYGLHVEEDNQTRLIPWSAVMGVSLKKR